MKHMAQASDKPLRWHGQTAPDDDDVAALAAAAVAGLPDRYRQEADQVLFRVVDLAPEEVLDDLGISDAFELTGLYEGVPLTEKSVSDPVMQPDAIWLYRLAILFEWMDRGDVALGDLVTHIVVHELAHHFGWSDDDIARIDPWWE